VDAFGEDYKSRGLVVTSNKKYNNSGMDGSSSIRDDGILGLGSAAHVHKGTLTTTSTPTGKVSEKYQVVLQYLYLEGSYHPAGIRFHQFPPEFPQ